jgi:beta-glucanase (GH16 family)
MENRGTQNNVIQGSIHYGGTWPNHQYSGSGEKEFAGIDFSADFHTFTFEWEKTVMRWSLDGKVYHTEDINKSMWSGKGVNPYTANGQPFDRPFFIVINIAVSGSFFPADKYGPPVTVDEAKKWEKPSMEIDYLRVYQK